MLRPRRLVSVAAFAVLLSGGCRSDSADSADTAGSALTADTTAAASMPSVATDSGAMLDPNTATREQLMAVPGMSAAAADALIAGRPYDDMRGVERVLAAHLSEEQREQVYAQVWKRIDLNTATGEEILLIPGVGERMRHEFEEYRPYRAIAQFRREMGKYVDSAEVARLERYVEIR